MFTNQFSCNLLKTVSAVFCEDSFKIVTSVRLFRVHLIVAARMGVDVQFKTSRVCSGFGGFCFNKGATSVELSVKKGSSKPVKMLFVNCHLTAHRSNLEKRNKDISKILSTVTGSGGDDHHFTCIFGDLNYRIEEINR
jgi:hypothetical protein